MSDLGNLSQCMVDSDRVASAGARVLRGKALVASLALEAIVIACVLLWPLVTLGVLPARLLFTPVPPYRGEQRARAVHPRESNRQPPNGRNIAERQIFQPPRIPSHVASTPDPEPPGVEAYGDSLTQEGSPDWMPAGTDNGPLAPVVRPAPVRKPRMVSLGVMDASLVHRVEPEYPLLAKTLRRSGSVVLRAVIATDGEVHQIEVLSGDPILAQAARAAVRQWRYRPTLLDGQAVEVETQITVNFVLE
jgi:protein TonB